MVKRNLILYIIISLWLTFGISCGFLDSYYYEENEVLNITTNGLNAIRIQIPFDYEYLQLEETERKIYKQDEISDLLTGSRQVYTQYSMQINKNETKKTYTQKTFTDIDVNIFKWLIERNYTINFYLDSLPAGRNITRHNRHFVNYNRGIPIGFLRNKQFYLYNHYNIFVYLHNKNNKYQIVGFVIEALSIRNNTDVSHDEYREDNLDWNQELVEQNIPYTYNVEFRPSNISFASRWDHYLGRRREMHWLGLINSNILIFIISFLVFYILSRAIKKDIEIYNRKVISDEVIDEYGWKQVCNDVFRRPRNLMLLCAFVGNGLEIFLMLLQTLYFSVLGFISPTYRGGLINIMIIVFCFMGLPAGFVSTFIYKTNGGKNWLKNSLLTTFLFPALVLIILFIVRIMFSFENSPQGMQLSEFVLLVVLWICISTPLVLIGSLIAMRKKSPKYPCKINAVPTAISSNPWYLKVKYTLPITGIIPFATVFIEFIYIMAAMWRHQVYFLASFVGFSVLFIVISSAEISIIFVYLNLCKGDYNWWWKSFFVGASPALYILFYSLYYFFFLNITRFTAMIVYFSLMLLISAGVALVCGGCSMILTSFFLYYIYSKIKID